MDTRNFEEKIGFNRLSLSEEEIKNLKLVLEGHKLPLEDLFLERYRLDLDSHKLILYISHLIKPYKKRPNIITFQFKNFKNSLNPHKKTDGLKPETMLQPLRDGIIHIEVKHGRHSKYVDYISFIDQYKVNFLNRVSIKLDMEVYYYLKELQKRPILKNIDHALKLKTSHSLLIYELNLEKIPLPLIP